MTDTLSPQARLEAVRAKIVEANPDLVFRDPFNVVNKNATLPAREIRLADVLLAFQAREMWVSVTESGRLGRSGIGGAFIDVRHQATDWNLRSDSLDAQSPETIAFLHSLLCA